MDQTFEQVLDADIGRLMTPEIRQAVADVRAVAFGIVRELHGLGNATVPTLLPQLLEQGLTDVMRHALNVTMSDFAGVPGLRVVPVLPTASAVAAAGLDEDF